MQIYVSRDGQQAGPYSPEHIQQELASGTLRASDLAWYEGAPAWLPLTSVPGLNAGAPFPTPTMPPPYAGGMPYAPQTSGLAVASMILGILGLFALGLTSLPAVICGHVSLSQIKRSAGRLGGQGMAIAGLVTGYLSMALFALVIVGVLAGIALPVFSTVQERGKEVKSLAMAKQIGLGCKLYAADNNGKFPKTLEELVPDFLSDKHLFVCPLDRTQSPMGYDYFGGTDDDPHRVLLQSKATTHDGKRVVIHVDNSGEMLKN